MIVEPILRIRVPICCGTDPGPKSRDSKGSFDAARRLLHRCYVAVLLLRVPMLGHALGCPDIRSPYSERCFWGLLEPVEFG